MYKNMGKNAGLMSKLLQNYIKLQEFKQKINTTYKYNM